VVQRKELFVSDGMSKAHFATSLPLLGKNRGKGVDGGKGLDPSMTIRSGGAIGGTKKPRGGAHKRTFLRSTKSTFV